MIQKVIWLVVLMGAVPLILGLPWVKVVNPKHKYTFAYSSGFFIALALFQVVSFPVIMSLGQFSIIVIVYSFALAFSCGFSLWYSWKNCLAEKLIVQKLHWTEWIYLVGFLFILGVQIVRAFTYDITYMSYDDATYTVYASDAYKGNGILNINAYTGVGTTLIAKYTLASWNVYPAYYASISGVSVATIAHTAQYVQLIILAYASCWFMAGEVMKDRDNQLIFMVIIALFYWFGYHSHYSLTFRLLGPNYQGKAVLAVSLTPLILTVLMIKMEDAYSIKTGIYLFVLSVAGVALTLWATGTILVIVIGPLFLSLFRRDRKWKQLFYVLWSCIIPVLALGFFLVNKFTM